MNMVALSAPPLTATERLRLYRSRHRIEVDRSGDWSTCDTDGLRVYQVVTRRWQHDMNEIRRLEKLAAGEQPAPDACIGCKRPIVKGSEDDFLSMLVGMPDGSLRLLCSYCQDRGADL